MGFFSQLFGKSDKNTNDIICAPIAGQAVEIAEVPDPVFAEGLLGKGIAIQPADGKVYAPVDGTVSMMFETGHAVSIVSKSGAEILIHVGLETVSLQGKPFTIHARSGDEIKKGQLLLEVDLEMIKEAGLPTITPVLVCNSEDYTIFNVVTGKAVTNDDAIIDLGK